MANPNVPNTTTFTLTDVAKAVFGTSAYAGKSLTQCFASAKGKFDTRYVRSSANKNHLLAFRNYQAFTGIVNNLPPALVQDMILGFNFNEKTGSVYVGTDAKYKGTITPTSQTNNVRYSAGRNGYCVFGGKAKNNATQAQIIFNSAVNRAFATWPITMSYWLKRGPGWTATQASGYHFSYAPPKAYGPFLAYTGYSKNAAIGTFIGTFYGDSRGLIGGNRKSYYWDNPLVKGTGWYHIVIIFDGNTSRPPKMYINGKSAGAPKYNSGTYSSPKVPFPSSNTLRMWGSPAYGQTHDRYTDNPQLIDEFYFWRKALSPSEISQLYNGGRGIFI